MKFDANTITQSNSNGKILFTRSINQERNQERHTHTSRTKFSTSTILRLGDRRNISRPPSTKRPAKDTKSGILSFAGRFWLSLGAQQKKRGYFPYNYTWLVEQQKQKNTQQKQRVHKMSFRATKRPRMLVLFFGAPSVGMAFCCWWALGTNIVPPLWLAWNFSCPAQEMFCWALFRRWARDFSGYRLV